MKIKPLGERLLLKRVEEDEQTVEELSPDSAKEKSQEAEVVALGTGKDDNGKTIPFNEKR